MKNTSVITFVFALIFLFSSIESYRMYKNQVKETKRIYNNLQAEKKGLKTYYVDKFKLIQSQSASYKKEEFKQLYAELYKKIKDSLNLIHVSFYSNISIEKKDSLKAKIVDNTFSYMSPSLNFKGILKQDTVIFKYRYNISIEIIKSVQRRKGFFNKMFFIPFKRSVIYTLIPSDSSIVVNDFQVKEIFR